ncbi:copper amine oxidase N-terminal domain-containing protein [Paenibacillus apii]|nr:copper amine oxidase N-terminal domain-containing protein [Paenibacillus apii]
MGKFRYSAALLWLTLLISIAPVSASAAPAVIKAQTVNAAITFDGINLQPPAGQYVFIYNNSTYVPLRFISYALQKSVSWDAKNVKVTISEPNSRELTAIKEYLMNAGNSKTSTGVTKTVALQRVNASYIFNGSAKNIPQGLSSYILNGTLYVPLRFLSEAAGTSLKWDQKTKSITAFTSAYKAQNPDDTKSNNDNSTSVSQTQPSTPSPAPSAQAGAGASGGGAVNKPTYEQITSETEAKLTSLESQAKSVLMGLAMEYLNAKDDKAKAAILSKGEQQLSSFTSSFNSIISDAESKLKANGYDTAIIDQYRSAFESQVNSGLELVKGMAG